VRTLVADEGKTCTNLTKIVKKQCKADPHPTSLRSATFPQGKAFEQHDKYEFMWRERAENGILLAVESGFLPVGAGKCQFPGWEGDF